MLGASARARAEDLNAAFSDPSIRAILATISGEDQITVVPHLRVDLALRDPKPFLGYSDNTNVLNWLWTVGIAGFHGGSTQIQLGPGPRVDPIHARSLRSALITGEPLQITEPGESEDVGHDWNDPRALTEFGAREPTEPWTWAGAARSVTGRTWGGCIEVVQWILTAGRFPVDPGVLDGGVLLLETSEELIPAREFGFILRSLGERGILSAVDAVVVARPPTSDLTTRPPDEERRARRAAQRDAAIDVIGAYNRDAVVLVGPPFGHTRPQWISRSAGSSPSTAPGGACSRGTTDLRGPPARAGYPGALLAHYTIEMRHADDQRLVRAARAGEAAAFAELIGRHYPMLAASCRRMLQDREAARDAAQEATVRAMLGLGQLRDDRRFGPWLVGIGLNVCRGWLLDQQLRRTREIAGEPPAAVDDRADPARWADAAELGRRVREAIADLPTGQRQAVALFYLGGLTHAEAAAELHTGPAAVKTRLHKARRTLRTSLQRTYEEFIEMTDPAPQMIPMRVAELRRAPSAERGLERHIVFLTDGSGRRLPIWIGSAEATWMALILEGIELPRPGVYHFAASLLAGAGTGLREVRISTLTDSTFFAQAILADGTCVDARPSDALTLALLSAAPILVSAQVLDRAELTDATRRELLEEANAATDDSRVIAREAVAASAAVHAALRDPED